MPSNVEMFYFDAMAETIEHIESNFDNLEISSVPDTVRRYTRQEVIESFRKNPDRGFTLKNTSTGFVMIIDSPFEARSMADLVKEREAYLNSIRHGKKWGKWTLDAPRLVLVYNAQGPQETDYGFAGYEVDLEKCRTSAAVLDWIFQVQTHRYDVQGLIEALEDLINPQSTLCPSCMHGMDRGKQLNATEHLKSVIRGEI